MNLYFQFKWHKKITLSYWLSNQYKLIIKVYTAYEKLRRFPTIKSNLLMNHICIIYWLEFAKQIIYEVFIYVIIHKEN